MKCPTCGAENEASNRFCEQCGSRITPSGGFQPAPADLAALPTAAGPTCPSCGAAVLPGEAFCDECGASLTGAAPAAAASIANDAPTMFAPAPPSAGGAPAADQGVTCPSCGHQNLPGDRFCDNCGADLSAAPAASAPATPAAPAPTPAADAPTILASPQDLQQAATATPEAAPVEPAAPVADPAADAAPAEPAAQAPAADAAPAAAELAAQAPAADAQAQYQAEQQRLGEEIARQQQIIAQFEQMQTMFGAATPPAVTQGLADARDAKARAEAELAALQPPAPAVDPAEVARLEEEIARQQQIIAQFEQMQTMFGAATPPAVTQGLADARDAKARAEADLAALSGGAPASAPNLTTAEQASLPTAEQPGIAPPVEAPAVPAAEVPAASAPVSAPAEPAAPPPLPPTSAPAAPRLVLDGGKELALPADKREIIIGREDPISGIFPEVDLTPFGGESGGVSRQHARLNNDGGQWTLTDLNSTNYTRVDGAKLEPNVPTPISSGAKLQFGRVALTFQA